MYLEKQTHNRTCEETFLISPGRSQSRHRIEFSLQPPFLQDKFTFTLSSFHFSAVIIAYSHFILYQFFASGISIFCTYV